MQKHLHPMSISIIVLFTKLMIIPIFSHLECCVKDVYFPTVSTWMFAIIVVLLVLTVVGIPLAIVMIIYAFIKR